MGPDKCALVGLRRALGGTDLRIRGNCPELRADWMECNTTLGLAAWANSSFPCFKCNATLENLHVYGSATTVPHQRTTDEEFAARIDEVTLVINVDLDKARAIEANLFFDKRKKNGFNGRVMARAVDGLPLQRGDRLEVGGSVLDTHDGLTTLPGYPAELTFFRRSRGNSLLFVSPLFAYGIITLSCVMVDVLHCLDLGVAQRAAGLVFAFIMQQDLFGTGQTSKGGKIVGSLGPLQTRLSEWYKANPSAARVNNVTSHMLLGPNEFHNPEVHAKGAESRGRFSLATHCSTRFEQSVWQLVKRSLHKQHALIVRAVPLLCSMM